MWLGSRSATLASIGSRAAGDSGARGHGAAEPAQEQDGRGLAGVVGALPVPGALGIAAADRPAPSRSGASRRRSGARVRGRGAATGRPGRGRPHGRGLRAQRRGTRQWQPRRRMSSSWGVLGVCGNRVRAAGLSLDPGRLSLSGLPSLSSRRACRRAGDRPAATKCPLRCSGRGRIAPVAHRFRLPAGPADVPRAGAPSCKKRFSGAPGWAAIGNPWRAFLRRRCGAGQRGAARVIGAIPPRRRAVRRPRHRRGTPAARQSPPNRSNSETCGSSSRSGSGSQPRAFEQPLGLPRHLGLLEVLDQLRRRLALGLAHGLEDPRLGDPAEVARDGRAPAGRRHVERHGLGQAVGVGERLRPPVVGLVRRR